MKHIRELYKQLGVDNYYRHYGDQYSNPHLAQIQALVVKNAEKLDYNSVLDFCAGGGEISLILEGLGYNTSAASDPYTQKLYEKNLNKKCYDWSFDAVIKGALIGNYSCIIVKW